MTVEMMLVLGLVVSAVILFATERFPADLVALIIMAALLLSSLITPEEAISGFSNPATITVGAMFVLSAGLYRTGAVNAVGNALARLGRKSYILTIAAMMLVIGIISAFINNTAAVVIFLPIVLGVARDTHTSASRLLMPLSYASMFGGVCTLVGTSTNILVSSIIERRGLAPIGMFELTDMGLIFFGAGVVYMLLAGIWLIPDRGGEDETDKRLGSGDYVTEIIIQPDARSVGTVLAQSPLLHELDLKSIEVFRDGRRIDGPPEQIELREGDHLKVRCDLENFRKIQQRRGISLRHESDQGGEGKGMLEETKLVEAVIAPNSTLDGRSLKEARFRSRYGFSALAIRHQGRVVREDLETIVLRAGDVLLFDLGPREIEWLRPDRTFVVISEVQAPVFRKRKTAIALAVVTAVVAGAALGVVPIMSGAIIGCIVMVLARCLSMEEAYEAIDWKVIMLMAGVVTLGIAMEKSGAALFLSKFIVYAVGGAGPSVMVAVLYLFSALATAVLSNNATVALLIPIVFATADSMKIDPRPLIMAVTFAASLDFMTPFGYQTNTLIYGPGRYRFSDYLRVGAPLNIIFWVLATIFIPRFWPF
ncbi:SLC13 family permease [Geobacter benzoatilyticus]|uniref:SLC13/DASS family transporter n=1 Tax=Geobacter benzoatilyticus TaxID=2815309 RepID=A0ABX7Q040_9BACT|nr:SLC13 family permease [Geobacter benzoatilyticus]QSV44582.1 SLC13/DASS family transporter [Geobacter benzoatilyticus]